MDKISFEHVNLVCYFSDDQYGLYCGRILSLIPKCTSLDEVDAKKLFGSEGELNGIIFNHFNKSFDISVAVDESRRYSKELYIKLTSPRGYDRILITSNNFLPRLIIINCEDQPIRIEVANLPEHINRK